METILLNEKYLDDLKSGKKQVTVRKDTRNYRIGPANFKCNSLMIPILINKIIYCTLENISMEIIKADGYLDLEDMLKDLRKFYPTISIKDEMTIVCFTLMENEESELSA